MNEPENKNSQHIFTALFPLHYHLEKVKFLCKKIFLSCYNIFCRWGNDDSLSSSRKYCITSQQTCYSWWAYFPDDLPYFPKLQRTREKKLWMCSLLSGIFLFCWGYTTLHIISWKKILRKMWTKCGLAPSYYQKNSWKNELIFSNWNFFSPLLSLVCTLHRNFHLL